MTSHNEHSVSREEVYLIEVLSRDGYLTLQTNFQKFLCSVFPETEMIDKQISFQQHVRSVKCLTLDKYSPNPFICL